VAKEFGSSRNRRQRELRVKIDRERAAIQGSQYCLDEIAAIHVRRIPDAILGIARVIG
jgi:hypothetical protein